MGGGVALAVEQFVHAFYLLSFSHDVVSSGYASLRRRFATKM
jgi:hypothetical protein